MYLQGLQGKISEFEAEGVQWIVIGDDASERLAEMKEKIGLTNVPFLVDATGSVGRDQYGLVYNADDHDGHLQPGVFVLGAEPQLGCGVVRDGAAWSVPGRQRLATGEDAEREHGEKGVIRCSLMCDAYWSAVSCPRGRRLFCARRNARLVRGVR